jgi:DNA-binding MarR family transcriptional regulator
MFFLKDLPSREMIESVAPKGATNAPEKVLRTLTTLRAASQLLREIEALLRQSDLSQTQFLVMMMILREPDRTSLSPGEIAEKLDISRPVLTRTLTTLTEKKLIENAKAQPTDKRRRELALTTTGAALFQDLLPGYLTLLEQADL